MRVFEWLDFLDLNATVHSYAGLSSNAPSMLGRHLATVLRAEYALRRLPGRVSTSPLLLSKQASPFSRGELEASLLNRSAHGVYDIDDSLRDETPAGPVKRAFPKAEIWRKSVCAADVVIAGNEYLADQAADLNGGAEIIVIPSCVDPGAYPAKSDYTVSDVPRAVWIGTPSTEPHLAGIAAPLLEVHRSHGLRLTLISSGARDLGPLSTMVDRVTWTPAAATTLASADLGLMPLPDTPQTRGKCAYKLLQYAAAGLPALASPVGANATALARGAGIDAEEDWAEHLRTVIEASATDREAVGVRARTTVAAHYSFAAWAERWRTAVLGS